jgi:hypothetical protein
LAAAIQYKAAKAAEFKVGKRHIAPAIVDSGEGRADILIRGVGTIDTDTLIEVPDMGRQCGSNPLTSLQQQRLHYPNGAALPIGAGHGNDHRCWLLKVQVLQHAGKPFEPHIDGSRMLLVYIA